MPSAPQTPFLHLVTVQEPLQTLEPTADPPVTPVIPASLSSLPSLPSLLPATPAPPSFPLVALDPSPAVFRLLWQRFGHLEKGPQQEKALVLMRPLRARLGQFPNAALRHHAALFEFRAFILARFFLSDRFSDSAAAAASFGYTPEQGARLVAAWKVIYGVAEEVRAARYRASGVNMEAAITQEARQGRDTGANTITGGTES